jgi:hypothetical protein
VVIFQVIWTLKFIPMKNFSWLELGIQIIIFNNFSENDVLEYFHKVFQ